VLTPVSELAGFLCFALAVSKKVGSLPFSEIYGGGSYLLFLHHLAAF
jgi:hypothetical protein